MEFLNSTARINTQIYPFFPFPSNKLSPVCVPDASNSTSITVRGRRKLYVGCPFSLNFMHSRASKKFGVMAYSRRHASRRNYLRKKLNDYSERYQVSPLQNPLQEFSENDVLSVDITGESSKILDERNSPDNEYRASGDIVEPKTESVKQQLEGSIMWNKLESWVEQYKKDSEFWGFGSGPVFTVFRDSEEKVERVVVNEDEILRRCEVDKRLRVGSDSEAMAHANFKISFAKDLAKEMEAGGHVIKNNSSVVKFISPGSKSGFMESSRVLKLEPGLLKKLPRTGIFALCCLFVLWAMKGIFAAGEEDKKHTQLEKEMLRRKIEARKEKENLVRGSIEVIQDPTEPKSMPFRRPQLDKEEILNGIARSKGLHNELTVAEYSGNYSKDFEEKIKQIRAMAKHAREVEKLDSSLDIDGENGPALNALSSDIMNIKNDLCEGDIMHSEEPDRAIKSNGSESKGPDMSNTKSIINSSNMNEENLLINDSGCISDQLTETPSTTKLRIIKSVEEAREFLSRKNHNLDVHQEPKVRNDEPFNSAFTMPIASHSSSMDQTLDITVDAYDTCRSRELDDFKTPHEKYNRDLEIVEGNADSLDNLEKSRKSIFHKVNNTNEVSEISINSIPEDGEEDHKVSRKLDSENERPSLSSMSDSRTVDVDSGDSMSAEEVLSSLDENRIMLDLQMHGTVSENEKSGRATELATSTNKENWMERNFHEFEPLIQRIGVGFRDNYATAREKSNYESDSKSDIAHLTSDGNEHELEWMKDEKLREIVFKVRDNELSGRDPFHLMDDEDKKAFFIGLEKKVEQENQKLLKLHEYFHANIENLDYGADGISLYDPPEKIIPRWKVPPAEKNPEFLANYMEQRKTLISQSLENSFITKKTGEDAVHELEELSFNAKNHVATEVTNPNSSTEKKHVAPSKTVIKGSDGSVRAGKKSGREYWQHTKKWSQGFLESYNAETDSEVKSVMSDIGKDLDRWITEKEIKEAADFLEKLPEKGQKLVKEKLDKVKREMELFGPQAVVSKYREYGDENEEDLLWWLDLPFVLCIELYTVENGEQKVGLYSLEMAADLELDPKQYHVIAFEDARDCNNLCYIIQAHLEMLGSGSAFVVARPPKDAFREAKANGFSVTVIRKGQLQLNIDQTLEEVDEKIAEIGSEIYHNKIMRDRSVDMKGLMRGVFGISKAPNRKRSKRKLKKLTKP